MSITMIFFALPILQTFIILNPKAPHPDIATIHISLAASDIYWMTTETL